MRRPATEEEFEFEIFVPLGLMERKQQQRRPLNQEIGMDQVYGVEEKAEITRKFEHQEFLTYIGLSGRQAENTKNVAIIGEPGAGKTTLLANLAQVIDENQGLPICISLGSLETGQGLEAYLEQKWLKDALGVRQVSETVKDELAEQFKQGDVWLLLDGLDEMQSSSLIEREVRSGYLQRARVVLTCRVNVWDANLTNPLRDFETYKTLDFTERQRDDFINQWFRKKGNLALGEGLIVKLKESGQERICELVKNPLRLVLLCYIWTQQAGELPETKAQFYQRYLRYFYEWKKEVRDLTSKRQQQAQLHQALGRLAIAGIESSSRYRLSESLAVQEMGEDCFQLAVDLGWLNIVDREQGTDEAVYAFFHPTFQEFFAACRVEDWDFFLPRDHVDCPVEGKVYRIFEAKWKEVILLWFGRGDISNNEKENFVEALLDGNGSFTYWDFYFFRKIFLAAAGIKEFRFCTKADVVIDHIIIYGFGYYDKEVKEVRYLSPDPIKEMAQQILIKIDRSTVIKLIIEYLYSSNLGDFFQGVEILESVGYGNQEAISLLENYLDYFLTDPDKLFSDQAIHLATTTLLKIDPGNKKAIDALIDLVPDYLASFFFWGEVNILLPIRHDKIINKLIELLSSPNKLDSCNAAQALLIIEPENKKANDVLIELLSSSNPNENISTFTSAARYLQLNNLGDPKVISILIYLLSSSDLSTRHIAIHLCQTAPTNHPGTTTFLNYLTSLCDKYELTYWWDVVYIIGQIGKGNQEVIYKLIGRLSSPYEEIRCFAACSLALLDPNNEEAITVLNNFLSPDVSYTRSVAKNALELLLLPPMWVGENYEEIIELINFISFYGQYTYSSDVVFLLGVNFDAEEHKYRRMIAKFPDLIDLFLARDELIRLKVAKILLEIAPGNQEGINTLTNFLNFVDKNILNGYDASKITGYLFYSYINFAEEAYEVLKKIDPDNQIFVTTSEESLFPIETKNDYGYIANLIDGLSSLNTHQSTYAAKRLSKIAEPERIPEIINALKGYLLNEIHSNEEYNYDNHSEMYKSCYNILWKYAEILSYPDFYKAWHSSDNPDTTPIGSTAFTQTLNLQLLPNELPAHCLYLDVQALNSYNLPELSQELCNLIHQHLNQSPIPPADNLPQLKRHLLTLLAQHPQLTLIFGNIYPSETLLTFCQQLNATLSIAWINDQTIPNLQTFSPQDPNLLEKILNWLNNAISEQ